MPYDVRMLVLQALREIRKGARPKEALDALPGQISKRDRSLFMELLYGVLRRQYLLDHLLYGFLSKAPKQTPTLDNLRMGLYQLIFTRVPERAAVNEAVRLEKDKKFSGAGKPALVNAVLRNAARGKDALMERLDQLKARSENPSAKEAERLDAIGTFTSTPSWLIKRWARRFGADEALALALAGNRIPPLSLRVNTLRKTREEVLDMLAANGISAGPSGVSPAGIKIGGSAVSFRDLGFIHPFCIAQDEAAQLAGFLLAPVPGDKVLDACAAPGGKTTHIAELMKDRGEIVALDTDEKRIGRIRENVSRLGITSVSTAQEDITARESTVYKKPGYFDRILLDAPCSSLGVIRRNPDVKYRHGEEWLARSGRKELQMLMAAAPALKKGGVLVFSTCSTEPEEGEMVIDEFLASGQGGDFRLDTDMPQFLLPFSEKGYLRTYPHRQDMDGFFMAKLKKQ